MAFYKVSNSLKNRLFRSWCHLGLAAFGSSLLVTGLLVLTEHQNQIFRIKDDLNRKGSLIARRICGELLIGSSGLPGPVISDLKDLYGVPVIKLLPAQIECNSSQLKTENLCKTLAEGKVWTTEKIPSIDEDIFVFIGSSKPVLSQAFHWQFLLLGALPVFLMIGLGIFLQSRLLKKELLGPLEKLVEGADSKDFRDLWPVELRTISNKLNALIVERNNAVHAAHHFRTQGLLGSFAEGVIHDIQTPLTTLGMKIDSLRQISSETKDQIKRLLDRPREIIKDHLRKIEKETHSDVPTAIQKNSVGSVASVGGVANTIVEEFRSTADKKGVLVNTCIPKIAFNTFVPLSFSELSRVLSNILENAIHATQEAKRNSIFFSITLSDESCEILVKDTGSGFRSGVLEKLKTGQKYTTKATGNGIGFISASDLVDRADGNLNVFSSSVGSLVRIQLPISEMPSWFEPIQKRRFDEIIALDDDLTLKAKLSRIFPDKPIEILQSETQFLEKAKNTNRALLLVDFDFNGRRDGLNLIIEEGLVSQAVLLSGRISFDENIRSVAEKLNVKLFPKECLL